MKEWIIIGGGMQGCTLASHLLGHGCLSSEDLLMVDPHPEPFANWKKYTSNIAMTTLRSPAVHHVAPDPYHIMKFAKSKNWNNAFYGYYKKPTVPFFNDHCEEVMNSFSIMDCWKKGRVSDIERYGDHWIVTLVEGEKLFGKNVAITAGFTEQFYIPDWALKWKNTYQEKVLHVFELDEHSLSIDGQKIGVVGGGISGAHTAMKYSDLGKHVTLFLKQPLCVKEFDSDPGWLGPKNMHGFACEEDYVNRRSLISTARNKGSLPPNIYQRLMKYVKKEKVTLVYDPIDSMEVGIDSVLLNGEMDKFKVDALLFATGFSSDITQIDWLQQIIQREQLTCAHCGFPVVDKDLQWTRGLYVTGALAELEIGPTARNISGARVAATRIVQSFERAQLVDY